MWAVYYTLYKFPAVDSYALTDMTLFSKLGEFWQCEQLLWSRSPAAHQIIVDTSVHVPPRPHNLTMLVPRSLSLRKGITLNRCTVHTLCQLLTTALSQQPKRSQEQAFYYMYQWVFWCRHRNIKLKIDITKNIWFELHGVVYCHKYLKFSTKILTIEIN